MIDHASQYDTEPTAITIRRLQDALDEAESTCACLRYDLMLRDEHIARLETEIELLRRRLHSKRMRHH